MNHPSLRELHDFADRTLDAASAARVGAHLASCPRCAAEHRLILMTGEALRRLPPESPSPGFTARLHHALGLRQHVSLWWLVLRNLAPLVAAVAVAAVILTLGAPGGGLPGGDGVPGGGSGAGSVTPAPRAPLVDPGAAAGAIRSVAGRAAEWTGAVTARLVESTIGGNSLSQLALAGLVLGMLALLDRFLLGPIFRRRS